MLQLSRHQRECGAHGMIVHSTETNQRICPCQCSAIIATLDCLYAICRMPILLTAYACLCGRTATGKLLLHSPSRPCRISVSFHLSISIRLWVGALHARLGRHGEACTGHGQSRGRRTGVATWLLGNAFIQFVPLRIYMQEGRGGRSKKERAPRVEDYAIIVGGSGACVACHRLLK